MIKFLDLKAQYESIKIEIDNAIHSVINDCAFIGGKYVKEFEEKFAAYQQAKYCIGVGNGTDAIEIAIKALEIPNGSEIIIPANTFIATSEAVTRAGCKVVFCNCDQQNYTISVKDAKKRINDKTKAIIAVHLFGHPCNMDAVMKIAEEISLKVIEDCAQAHGAEYKGKRVGTIGDIGIFSFYPGKILGAYGDAGAIVTNDDEIATKARMISNHGRLSKYNHEFEGRNSRLDGIQAAILSVKLNHIDEWILKRIKIANCYYKYLKDNNNIVLPKREKWAKAVYHLFVIRIKQRDDFQKYLTSCGIQTGIHYPIALPKLQAYNYIGQADEAMFCNQIYTELLSLPMGEHLNISQIKKIIEVIGEYTK